RLPGYGGADGAGAFLHPDLRAAVNSFSACVPAPAGAGAHLPAFGCPPHPRERILPMSKKVNLAVAATVTLIAMAVTFSITMVVSMDMFNNIVSGVKNREQMYNKLAEIDRYVRNNEYAEINEDTLNDTIASGYMLGISEIGRAHV